MHFITGGAFNGKRAWVKKVYQIDKQACWVSAYDLQPLPRDVTPHKNSLLILEGIELWVKALMEHYGHEQVREFWNTCLDGWLKWENDREGRNLVIIGTDITKGIVPLEKEHRLWRDLAGWVYQDTAAKAIKMDVIWYGINQLIK